MNTDNDAIKHRLRHVYWLGGGSGAGKSTVARRLAAAHDMRLYDTDQAMPDHANRSAPQDAPFLAAFKGMDMDERWLNRPPERMLETFHWFRGEAFSLIIEDLLALPTDRRIVVEGFRLLPGLVAPLLADRRQSAWLIPTPAFRLAAFTSRGTLMDIAGKTSDPPRALENLLKRDAMFTDLVAHEANDEGLSIIDIDTAMTVDDLTSRVADQFRL